MKCTNRRRSLSHTSRRAKRYKTRHKNTNVIKSIASTFGIFIIVIIILFGLTNFLKRDYVLEYETEYYNNALMNKTLFAEELCIVNDNVAYNQFASSDTFKSISVINLRDNTVILAENMHETIYPASLTKLMTFHLAMKYSSLEDIVEVSQSATILPSGSSRAWLKANDRLTMKDLLYSMMLASGNDSAIAIAEHISGSEVEFAKLMNQEAELLGATNTHFVNSHGYHDENQYSTAYDLYLLMNECLKYDAFIELISTDIYETAITEPNGYARPVYWSQTNAFLTGVYETPKGVNIIGGKTGTTDEAGYCLMLYFKDNDGVPYLASIMGAETNTSLYTNMTSLISTVAN